MNHVIIMKMHVASEIKVEFINRLSKTGLRRIEATSFVSPKWVPQFADAKQVMSSIERNPLVRYSTLTPNLNGFNSALGWYCLFFGQSFMSTSFNQHKMINNNNNNKS